MTADLTVDNVLIQVRANLQENNVKLWLPPYYSEEVGSCELAMESLGRDLCQVLNIPYNYCMAALTELQSHALEKLKSREEFAQTGVATVKVRIPSKVGGTKMITVKQKLDALGIELEAKLSKELDVSLSRVRLISNGKVIKRDQLLESQGIKNNQQIMAIVLEKSEEEANKEQDMRDRIEICKRDAVDLLENPTSSYVVLEDQQGNSLNLPAEEKKQLLIALALHEKARAALKKEKYHEALAFLLEADDEFSRCQSNILESVDNAALINLDIVWCYLCLRSLTQLPDAERRLLVCEDRFKRSYGEDFSRVSKISGNAQNEKALIMRLHLLKGVLYFHQNRRSEAQVILAKAEAELRALKVDDNLLISLVDMGYSHAEARIGLRATNNSLESAITFIEDRKKERLDARIKGEEMSKLSKMLSDKHNKFEISVGEFTRLEEMGYEKELCAMALKKCDNNLSEAINLLQENVDTVRHELAVYLKPDTKLVEELEQMGYHTEMAKMALTHNINKLQPAIEMLSKLQSDGTYEQTLDAIVQVRENQDISTPSTSTSSIGSKQYKSEKEMKNVFERFAEDMIRDEDNYLDLPLVQEETILMEYKRQLN